MTVPRTFQEAWDWIRGRDPLPPPNPDRIVEAAWVPAWQGQMLTDQLVEAGIPATVAEDFTINVFISAREPMSRIFVTEDRRLEAVDLIEELLGHPPRRRGL